MDQYPNITFNDSSLEEDWDDNSLAIFCIEGILLPLFGFFGICGNIASIIHFGGCPKTRQNFQLYMFYLGIVDLFLIISSIIIHSAGEYQQIYYMFHRKTFLQMSWDGHMQINENVTHCVDEYHIVNILEVEKYFQFYSIYNQIRIYLTPFYCTLISMNIYLHLAISIERYMVICRSFRHMKCKKYQSRTVIVVITLLAFLYNTPKIFEHKFEYKEVFLPSENMTMCEPGKNLDYKTFYFAEICPTDLRKNQNYVRIMASSAFLFMSVIPYLSILILNALILKNLIIENEWASACNPPKMKLEDNSGLETAFASKSVRFSNQSQKHRPKVHYHVDKRRRNDVLLAKLSLLIMVPYLAYHTVRMVHNVYELTKVIYFSIKCK